MLTVCPTPIGNLGDISERQREALSNADIIACEDTRVTGKLLELLGIGRVEGRPRLWRFDDHNEHAQIEGVLAALREGTKVVLVSDAGMPCIADPGFKLVRAVHEQGLPYDVLPGANAALVALVGSGLPIDRFVYAGFLPAKTVARCQEIERLNRAEMTWCVYEAPHRLLDTLEDIIAVCGPEHAVFVGRELTKLHQEYLGGSAVELMKDIKSRDRVRGECVVVVAPGAAVDSSSVSLNKLVIAMNHAGCSPQQIKSVSSSVLGVSKADAYALLQSLKGP